MGVESWLLVPSPGLSLSFAPTLPGSGLNRQGLFHTRNLQARIPEASLRRTWCLG